MHPAPLAGILCLRGLRLLVCVVLQARTVLQPVLTRVSSVHQEVILRHEALRLAINVRQTTIPWKLGLRVSQAA